MQPPKRTLFLLLCLLASEAPAFSQESELQAILNLAEDSIKVDKLNDYSNRLIDINVKRSRALYEKSLELSTNLNYHTGTGAALIAIGYINAMAGNYHKAIQDFNNSIVQFQKAGKTDRVCRCLTNIGAMYEVLGKPDSAMLSYMRAVNLLENTTCYSGLGNVYCSIGILHGNTKHYEKSVYYKAKAITIARQQKDTVLLVEALTELADTYGEMNEPKKGIPLAFEALPLAKTQRSNAAMAATYYTISALQLGLHRADSAIYSARQSMYFSTQTGDESTYMAGALCLSDGYNLLNNQKNRLTVLKVALAKGLKAGTVMLLDDIYKRKADANYKLGNYQEAYADYLNYTIYKDSALNEKNDKAVAELEIKYETAQKEKALSQKHLELTQKNLQLEKERNYLYFSLAGLLVALLVSAIIFLQLRHKKINYAKQLASIQQQKEFQLLQALMQGEEKERSRIAKDLHDGVAGMLAAVKMHFSTIAYNNQSLVQTEGYKQGIHLLNEAANEVRKTSHNLMPEMLFQHGLDEALRRYCNSLNNSRTLEVQYDSWGNLCRLTDHFELSVYRIVQELINNIIKHSKASLAMIQVSQHNRLLTISIEDNGIGFCNPDHASDGMGLRSLKARIQAMNGRMELTSQSGAAAYLQFDTTGLEKM